MKWNNRCINCGKNKQFSKQQGYWIHSGTLNVNCEGIKPQKKCQ